MTSLRYAKVNRPSQTPENAEFAREGDLITTQLRNRLFVSVSLPTGLAFALLYLAAVAGGDDGKWLFRMGITFAVCAFICGRITWISYHHRIMKYRIIAMENRIIELTKVDQVRGREIAELKQDIDAGAAAIAVQQAFGRVAQRNGGRHLHSTHLEDAP